jgi:hypothetical protein
VPGTTATLVTDVLWLVTCWRNAGEAAVGVTELEAAEGFPVPTLLVAVTVNEYAVPFVRPVRVAVVVGAVTVVDAPPGLAVTV